MNTKLILLGAVLIGAIVVTLFWYKTRKRNVERARLKEREDLIDLAKQAWNTIRISGGPSYHYGMETMSQCLAKGVSYSDVGITSQQYMTTLLEKATNAARAEFRLQRKHEARFRELVEKLEAGPLTDKEQKEHSQLLVWVGEGSVALAKHLRIACIGIHQFIEAEEKSDSARRLATQPKS